MSAAIDRTTRWAVLGAGCSGLAAARHLRAVGLECDLLERQADLGGNWNYRLPESRVYQSTHTISSKRRTQFPDFPMPAEYPDYPHHAQVLAYLRSYARHFDLDARIEFNTAVARAEPRDDGRWRLELVRQTAATAAKSSAEFSPEPVQGPRESRDYAGLVIANGHHRRPYRPQWPGEFSGTMLHSADYKTPDVFAGRRVLVVGGGNSGCDLAVEAAAHAAAVWHSTRRGYHIVPKHFWGVPADLAGDALHKWRWPLALRRAAIGLLLRWTWGDLSRYGVPRPDHRLFETHPIINSRLPELLRTGQVRPKPDVTRLAGPAVEFADGSREPIDLILLATGFDLEFDFIDHRWLNWHHGRPRLYKHLFHPERDNLFVLGMIQPDSGLLGPLDWQARAMAAFVDAVRRDRPAAGWLRRQRQQVDEANHGGIRYCDSPRHALEVEHWSYVAALRQIVRRLERGATSGAARPLPLVPGNSPATAAAAAPPDRPSPSPESAASPCSEASCP